MGFLTDVVLSDCNMRIEATGVDTSSKKAFLVSAYQPRFPFEECNAHQISPDPSTRYAAS